MSFSIQGLSQFYAGGTGGNSYWQFRTTDNVASYSAGATDTTYFRGAVLNGTIMRAGDILDVINVATVGTPMTSRWLIPSTWDSNGATILLMQKLPSTS